MKQNFSIFILFYAAFVCAVTGDTAVHTARAAELPLVKLPYAKGESFVVTQGYDSPPTHIKKDSYALDLTQGGCDAYGKAVVAAGSGSVRFASERGYNGGYGTELVIDHGGGIVSRYAHMVPDSIPVASSAAVRRGEVIGRVGDTGLVAGAACADHPGTHLHFAMDTVNTDGSFAALNPEPISGYNDITEGRWYLSDNGYDADADSADVDINPSVVNASSDGQDPDGQVLGAYLVTPTTTTDAIIATNTIAEATISVPAGGVSIISPSSVSEPTPTFTQATPPSSSEPSDVSSTIIDGDVATSTATSTSTSIAVSDSTSTTTSTNPILFEQLDDSVQSPGSWYDDNWFDLGNGFGGTLNTLTLEGRISDSNYLASHIWLQEFKDPNYTAMIQQFTISDNAPFTDVMATATFTGLDIPLKPYFYYRLATIQDWQNRSVILAGTPSTTVGVVMWDNFIYGSGRVESTSTYFPYMVMEGVAPTSTLMPAPLPPPSDIIIDFDEMNMTIAPIFTIWPDPEWPTNPLDFQMNVTTSTSLSDNGWMEPVPTPVIFPNTYLIGIRAKDNYGAVSVPATVTWNFPAGFLPYVLSPQLGTASQYFNVPATDTLSSIQLFTANFQTSARNPEYVSCSLSLYDYSADGQTLYGVTQSDNGVDGYSCTGAPIFSFASSSIVLSPSHRYEWVFQASMGNPSTGASVQFYGNANNTAHGLFSDPSLVNARFFVRGDSGIVFSN